MKKILSFAVFFLFMCSFAFGSELFNGQRTSIFPATKTASALISTGVSILHGGQVNTDGINAVTLTFYDNITNSAGANILPIVIIPASSGSQSFSFSPPLYASTGIYVTISVAGAATATVWINYDKKVLKCQI